MIIAIIGATGLVGRKILKILDEFGYLCDNQILLYASKKSCGKVLTIKDNSYVVQELSLNNINPKTDFAFFCAGTAVSKQWAPIFAHNRTVVIDNSNAFRRDLSAALVVPEINFDSITNQKIISNPNCSTIGLSLVLHSLSKLAKINRVIVSTFQSASGGGQKGIDDLKNNSTTKFPHLLSNNLIPHIDSFLSNDYTLEEDKLFFETNRLLKTNIPLCATCVRVPIEICHSEAVNIEFETAVSIQQIKQTLNKSKGIILADKPNKNLYPMPVLAQNKNEVFVGRIRQDPSNPKAINLFLCFDNIRKGASLNAVQIMHEYIKKYRK